MKISTEHAINRTQRIQTLILLGESMRTHFSQVIKMASLVAQLVKNPSAMWETLVWFLGWEDPLEKEWLPTPVFWPGEVINGETATKDSNEHWILKFKSLSQLDVDRLHQSSNSAGSILIIFNEEITLMYFFLLLSSLF